MRMSRFSRTCNLTKANCHSSLLPLESMPAYSKRKSRSSLEVSEKSNQPKIVKRTVQTEKNGNDSAPEQEIVTEETIVPENGETIEDEELRRLRENQSAIQEFSKKDPESNDDASSAGLVDGEEDKQEDEDVEKDITQRNTGNRPLPAGSVHRTTSHLTPVPARPLNSHNNNTQRLIVVLDQACLEIYKVGKAKDAKYQLLNCDDHQGILKKLNRNIAQARPDITHQCLLTLLDSPLNKAGRLQVYIHTAKKVLVEVNPSVRIPRTFKRFSGLMVQLLHKLSIRSVNGNEKLLKVIKNPVTDYLPPNCRKATLSFDAPTVPTRKYLEKLEPNQSVCIAIGAMAHGPDDFSDGWVDEKISISDYPLSASIACSKFIHSMEDFLGIV
ncbi:ribosome biogenesis protein Mra1 [Schizosaccharomyces octosporus yFS286]|uniref:Ribosome biogenesis protein Mra1 n=1 Tax=Schizosaccharomyces octosporus (strain yFS286) TaxID=483514 RepID=S9PN20_SCHOY|nr:ribosome biogenesis protein Mra1 [Schizosaccharomyces octosporus yFS286]EPX70626.1 ribosome biogenesis protein Mra1 [Schizosaccharomyces octosporus yFS286]